MEIITPTQEFDFEFNSARNSPYPSAPSTPRGFGGGGGGGGREYYYTSAPSSPSRLSEFYQEFDGFQKFDDFAFDVTEEVNETSAPAEDLFDGGMIKKINTPLPPQNSSSEAEKIPDIFQNLRLSSRNKKENGDSPFGSGEGESRGNRVISERAGRERDRSPSLSSASRRAARSVSPLRVSKYPWEEEKQKQSSSSSTSSSSGLVSSSTSGKSQRKWRLRDFFLFRSASEGSASDKDALKKYTANLRRKNSGKISAHELHYTANRAAKEEMKKKTFLPYKPGFFGRIHFNPAMAVATGFPVYK